MKTSNYLPLFFAIIGLLTITTSFSQNNTKNVYLINPVSHNTKLIDTDEKLNTVTQSLKHDILKSGSFIFISKLSKGRFLLLSSHNETISVHDLQKIFTPYSFGVKILKIKEITPSQIDLSSIPVYTNQQIDVFDMQIATWEASHTLAVEQLKNLFNN